MNPLLEYKLKNCPDREQDKIIVTGETTQLCNSPNSFCSYKGNTILYRGQPRALCTHSSNT